LALLYFYVSTFRSMCAVPNMAVFCSSFTSWFPDMLLMYCLNDFEMVPVAPIITGITLVFTFHMHCIYIVRSLYFKIFSASFLITFLSPEIATSINIHVHFSLSWIIIYYYYYYYYNCKIMKLTKDICFTWHLGLIRWWQQHGCSSYDTITLFSQPARLHTVISKSRVLLVLSHHTR